ncbi:MAG: hypothetical protein AAGN66_09195 [Acidobacteriota bacterium]
MLREFTKSMFRFSWAMGMLGVEQASNMLQRQKGVERSAESLDAVSHAATRHLSETTHNVFRAGDHLQSGVVDSMSKVATGSWSQPGKVMNDAWETLDRTWTDIKSDLRRKGDDPASIH